MKIKKDLLSCQSLLILSHFYALKPFKNTILVCIIHENFPKMFSGIFTVFCDLSILSFVFFRLSLNYFLWGGQCTMYVPLILLSICFLWKRQCLIYVPIFLPVNLLTCTKNAMIQMTYNMKEGMIIMYYTLKNKYHHRFPTRQTVHGLPAGLEFMIF